MSRSYRMALLGLVVAVGACSSDKKQPQAPVAGDLAISDAFTADGLTITVDFNKPVQAATVAAAAFQVTGPGGAVAGTIGTCTAASTTQVTLVMSSALPFGPAYAVVATGLLDADGKISTVANGTHAVRTPTGGWEGDLALTAAFSSDGLTIKATFSKDVSTGALSASAFAVTTTAGAAAATAASATAIDARNVSVTLSTALTAGTSYVLVATGVVDTTGKTSTAANSTATIMGPLYLNMVWHQHQPVYTDPVGDYARGPWVRKHGVKDYYDMAATIAKYPKVHCAINLTPVLLMQLQKFYLDRIGPFVDTSTDTFTDIPGYFAQKSGVVSDPWVDILLQDTPAGEAALTDQQKGWWWKDTWSAFSISDVMIARFPEYLALRDKKNQATATGAEPAFSQAELRKIKIYFELAWFDPDFLRGPVTLPDGNVVDLSDLVTENTDGTFTAKVNFGTVGGEFYAKRLVVEDYKILKNIVAIHSQVAFDADTQSGQVEVLTTPYFHPILPLITDTDLAREAMATTPMPANHFQHPEDADAHVKKAIHLYQTQFSRSPTGMWPAEGSVAQAVVPAFVRNGVRWVATDRRVLESSQPAGGSYLSPYRATSDDASAPGDLAIVFRDTAISDAIGFQYQGSTAATNIASFMQSLHDTMGPWGQDRLLTVILDGENAWEWYSKDNDAKGFLNGMYVALEDSFDAGEIITTTVSEYLDGNPTRHVPAHPVNELPGLTHLWAGSWINANYDTWIGEDEENTAWDYLYDVRTALGGWATQYPILAQPDPMADPPSAGTPERAAWDAWESMYAAEGSDWFWWYGSDQTAAGGDGPFDKEFVALLKAVYANAKVAVPAITDTFDPPLILRVCNAPTAAMSAAPTIDGVFNPDNAGDPSIANEWTQKGSGVCQDVDSGAVMSPTDVIGLFYWGWMDSSGNFYVALQFNKDVSLETSFDVRLYFSQKHIIDSATNDVTQDPYLATTRAGTPINFSVGGAAREVSFGFDGTTLTPAVATVATGAWTTPAPDATIIASTDGLVLEAMIPFTSLNYTGTANAVDPLEMLITAEQNDVELDRAPNLNSVVVFPDRTAMVEVTFILDATGSVLPLTKVKPIDNPVPPNGDGKAFIVGSLTELANWTPNTIQMYDDGLTSGDEHAGDNYWTYTILVPPLTQINYKYTIGHLGDGWGPSEEFPLTNRLLVVTDHNGDRKMVIKDIFADRPNPSGSMAALSQLIND